MKDQTETPRTTETETTGATEQTEAFRHGAHVTAESLDGVTETTTHRDAGAFVETVEAAANATTDRRVIEPTEAFSDGVSDALDVARVGFRNGRTAALRSRPGDEPDTGATVESSAFGAELNARQYTGHVPHVIYGRSGRESLWHCYERAVSAGIGSVRLAPFGTEGPAVLETADRGFNVPELLSDRLQIEPTANGRRAYDTAVPRSFVEDIRPTAPDGVHVASQFVWSYANAGGVPFPITETGVSFLRSFNERNGSRYTAPARVARFVEA